MFFFFVSWIFSAFFFVSLFVPRRVECLLLLLLLLVSLSLSFLACVVFSTLVLQPSKHYGPTQRKREDHHTQTVPCEWLVLLFWSALWLEPILAIAISRATFFSIVGRRVESTFHSSKHHLELEPKSKLHQVQNCTVVCCLRVRDTCPEVGLKLCVISRRGLRHPTVRLKNNLSRSPSNNL